MRGSRFLCFLRNFISRRCGNLVIFLYLCVRYSTEHMMKRISFLFACLLGALAFHAGEALAQLHTPVRFAVTQNRLSDTEFEVVFTGKVDTGWHVYATDIKDDGPTAATLTLETQQGVTPKGKLRATGKVINKWDEMFEMEVPYMEGTASFAQTFVVTAPSYDVSGYLTYGACSDMSCMPPTNVDFSFRGTKARSSAPDSPTKGEVSGMSEKGAGADPASISTETEANSPIVEAPSPYGRDSVLQATETGSPDSAGQTDLWASATDELKAFSDGTSSPAGDRKGGEALQWIFLLGLLGGFAALLTPCVWPIIPMTVSFFLKRNKDDRGRAIRAAVTYGISIIIIYMALGLLVTLLFGASALNAMSTNAVFNIFFFLLLLLFGISFLGGFEISLPGRWSNAVDSKAAQTTGLLSIFLMAFTLSLVSFSCTGPIIGFLLVEVASTGNLIGPAAGMFGFAVALALPFTLFALFPSWLKRAPKSGGWMNRIKVTLGFLELAFSLKFLSVADLAYGWHILDREVFFCLWIVLFALLGAYLIGWLRFPHDDMDEDEPNTTSVLRFFPALLCFAFALYMVPALWGAPCEAVSAFAPPMQTQTAFSPSWGGTSSSAATSGEAPRFEDYEEGMAYARRHGKPVLLDFTGYGCVNCRKMEATVWANPEVKQMIADSYVVISLWVDDKTRLPEVQTVVENSTQTKLRTVGDKWSYLQRRRFGANAQPFYVPVAPDGRPLSASYGYNEDVEAFKAFLKTGLKNYETLR